MLICQCEDQKYASLARAGYILGALQAASAAELVRALMTRHGTMVNVDNDEQKALSAFDWLAFGANAADTYRSVHSASMDCMLGAMEPPKIKAPAAKRERKKKVDLGPAERPDDMDTAKQDDLNETSKLTEAMYERVEEVGGGPYAHFVLDHESFAQTVENMFSIAMLVGSAKVALRPDDEWGMRVELPQTASQARAKGEPAQMVLNMNFKTWAEMKVAVDASDCITPHRAAMDFAHIAGPSSKRACAAV
jgi:non-structural maintenance of chromosomes element 4